MKSLPTHIHIGILTFSILCHQCKQLRISGNKRGTVFLRCSAPELPKYAPQPVRRCPAFVAHS